MVPLREDLKTKIKILKLNFPPLRGGGQQESFSTSISFKRENFCFISYNSHYFNYAQHYLNIFTTNCLNCQTREREVLPLVQLDLVWYGVWSYLRQHPSEACLKLSSKSYLLRLFQSRITVNFVMFGLVWCLVRFATTSILSYCESFIKIRLVLAVLKKIQSWVSMVWSSLTLQEAGGADSARPEEKLRFWYILVIQLTRKNLTFPKQL